MRSFIDIADYAFPRLRTGGVAAPMAKTTKTA
jgi:hypothetical protein